MGLSDFSTFANITQSLTTVIAILVGGFWSYTLFVKKRQDYPKAKIEHKVTRRVIQGDMILLSIDVFVYNTGDVIIILLPWEITIKQMLPPRSELLRFMKDDTGSNERSKELIEWDIIASKKVTAETEQCEIEPGECEQLHYDFLIKFKVNTILMESYFHNRRKHGSPSIGWRFISIYDLDKDMEPVEYED
jgi:hypothetical protein